VSEEVIFEFEVEAPCDRIADPINEGDDEVKIVDRR
jgi:hypothetical protein